MCKVRMGFVSNSSSSSFIVGIKSGEEMNTVMLSEAMNVPDSSPLKQFSNDLVSFIVSKSREVTKEEIERDYEYTIDELAERGYETAILMNHGCKVYQLDASRNESDDPIEIFIGNGGLDDIDTRMVAFRGESC